MPANWTPRRAAERALAALPSLARPSLVANTGERLDPAALLDRRGERLWLLAGPGAPAPDPLPWLLTAGWRRAAADPPTAQLPVPVDLAELAADGPVTSDVVLRAITAAPPPANGYLVLLSSLDAAGGAVRAAVAGLPGPLSRAAPASTIVTVSHAEPVPGFHIPAVVPQPPTPPDPHAAVAEADWDGLAGRLRTQRPWPAGLLTAVVATCATAAEPLRGRILDDLATLPDRRLLCHAALATGAADDDGVRRSVRIEIESLAGTRPAARDAVWLSRLLAVLPLLPAAVAQPASPPEALPPAETVLRRLTATDRPGSAALTLLAGHAAPAAVAVAEESADALDLDAVARAADDPEVARAILACAEAVPAWAPTLVHRAQLQPAVARTLLAEREPGPQPGAAPSALVVGRWRTFRPTAGTAYGRLLDDVLARPWTWPPLAAPLLATLSRVRPPASPAPIALAALPRAAGAAVLAALAVLTIGRLTAGAIGPAAATVAVLAAVALAGALLARRLRRWSAPHPCDDDLPAPLSRESVLAGRRIAGVAPGRWDLDDRLRRACIRAGVPEAEITHLLRVLAARHARLTPPGGGPSVPEQGGRVGNRRATGG